MKFSVCAVVIWLLASGLPVNIFGDGNPLNGFEDGREPVLAKPAEERYINARYLNAGSITCDGKIRGTAMVVDTRQFAADFDMQLLRALDRLVQANGE